MSLELRKEILTEEWRKEILTEMLKLVSDKWIEVQGVKLQIKTFLSEDYHPEIYPWLADGNPDAPDEDGHTAEFDIMTPPSDAPTDYRYRITLIDT